MKPNERVFKIIVPIWKQEVIEGIAKRMSHRFGGVTIIPMTRGFWTKDGRNIYDDSVLMFSARDIKHGDDHRMIFANDWRFMEGLAGDVGRIMGQDAVYIEQDIARDVAFIPKTSGAKKIAEVI